MKKTTLPDVLRCLENLSGEVKLPRELIDAAYSPLQKMISIK
jgi:quinolinate synthase